MWAKRTLGRKRFFAYDRSRTQIVESFRFGSWGFSPPDGLLTEAHLFSDYIVLKLGQTEIGCQVIIDQRNLDFCDLDYLTVTEDFHGSMPAQINYSSCRGLRFRDAEVSFLSFHQCAFDEFFVDGSRLQDFHFDATLSWQFDLKARDSLLHMFSFKHTNLVPLISADCEIREFRFEPSSRLAPTEVAKIYRLLRSAYAMRWKIETFHKILKSGCRSEDSRLRTTDRPTNLISIYCILSWRLFWVTMLGRVAPRSSPGDAFAEDELAVLDQLSPKTSAPEFVPRMLSHYAIQLVKLGSATSAASLCR